MAVVQVSNAIVNEIFPSTKTKTINKLITENSLTRLINRLLDVDGYVITSEFSENFTLGQIKSNANDYIKITGNELDNDCEFSIRGYYFNIGTYRDILASNSPYTNLLNAPSNPSQDLSIIASIYISNDTEYPELYGQDVYESTTLHKGDATEGSPVLIPENTDKDMISLNSFRFFLNGNAVDITVSDINSSREILNDNDTPITWGTVDEVRYVVTFSNAALYLSNSVSETESEANQSSLLTDRTNFTRYDLEIFRLVAEDGQRVPAIPINSLHRFDTLAIASIDGGVIV